MKFNLLDGFEFEIDWKAVAFISIGICIYSIAKFLL